MKRRMLSRGVIALTGLLTLASVAMSEKSFAENKAILIPFSAFEVKEIRTFKTIDAWLLPDMKTMKLIEKEAETVTLYNLDDWREIKSFKGRNVYLSPNGELCVYMDFIDILTVYDTKGWKPLKTIKGYSSSFSADGRMMAVQDRTEKTITFYDTAGWNILRTLKGESVTYSPTGKMVAIRDFVTGIETIYEVAGWKDVRTFKGMINFSSDGKMVTVFDSKAKTVTVYEVAGWKLVNTFVGSAQFSPDGKILAVGDYEAKIVSIYDVASWNKTKTIAGGAFPSFSKDGRLVVFADSDASTISLYSVSSWEKIRTFTAKQGGFIYRSEILDTWDWTTKVKSFYDVSGLAVRLALEKDDFETTKEYEARIRKTVFPYASKVALRRYDADRESFEAEISGNEISIPVPREKAKQIINRRDKMQIQGKVKYFDTQNVQLVEAQLVDLVSKESFPFLTIGDVDKDVPVK